jgi:hypothetical protein
LRAAAITLLAGLLAACASPDPAEQGSSWYINDAPAPDTDWRKTDGPFGAQLFITDDAKSVYDFWVNEEGGVPIKRLDRAPAGTHVETIVFFIRCAPSTDGKCSVRGFVSVTRSDGKVLASNQELLLSEKPPPEGFNLGISEAGAGLELEDFDGSYLFEMRVLDAVANREVRLSQRIAVDR